MAKYNDLEEGADTILTWLAQRKFTAVVLIVVGAWGLIDLARIAYRALVS